MKFLACDIGNTSIKFGLYSENKFEYSEKISHDDFSISVLKKLQFEHAGISSVVPSETRKIIELFETQFEITPYILGLDSPFGFSIDYDTPETVGIDRLAGLEGALDYLNLKQLETNDNIVTIDFGTATTVNVLAPPCNFTGGLIAPGLQTMVNSLNTGTAQLPTVDLFQYQNLIGTDTNSCISSGVINSTLGMIERVYSYITKKNDLKPSLLLTGGNADLIIPYLKVDFELVEDLVLRGIKSVSLKAIGS